MRQSSTKRGHRKENCENNKQGYIARLQVVEARAN